MRRIGWVLTFAVLVATALSLDISGGGRTVQASVNKNVHVHDDFYHPAGAFTVGTGTDHNVAQAACQKTNPDAACDAVIQQGDTITWVAPAPLAANQHTVTECTDSTFSVCGPAVSAANPIGDSGVRAPPPALAPTGWPYGPVQFNATGTYYYRCEIHPNVMRGRIVVQSSPAVGGIAVDPVGVLVTDAARGSTRSDGAIAAMIVGGALTAVIALGGMTWYGRRRWPR